MGGLLEEMWLKTVFRSAGRHLLVSGFSLKLNRIRVTLETGG
jgi:hypothetical protein